MIDTSYCVLPLICNLLWRRKRILRNNHKCFAPHIHLNENVSCWLLTRNWLILTYHDQNNDQLEHNQLIWLLLLLLSSSSNHLFNLDLINTHKITMQTVVVGRVVVLEMSDIGVGIGVGGVGVGASVTSDNGVVVIVIPVPLESIVLIVVQWCCCCCCRLFSYLPRLGSINSPCETPESRINLILVGLNQHQQTCTSINQNAKTQPTNNTNL
jgi:hypothetical protein